MLLKLYLLEKVKAIGNNALEHWAKSLDVEVSAIEQGSDYLAACAKSPTFAEDSDWFQTQKQSLKQGESAAIISLLET